MSVLLRSKLTRLYWAAPNGWTAAEAQALDFTSVPEAASFARDKHLAGLEIVLTDDIKPAGVVGPVLPEGCDVDRPGSMAA